MAVSFDGDNLIITLESGVTSVDAEVDLYKEWKLWQLAGNLRFPQAFRTIGGDALTGSVDAGAYFFLQNQNGWRIRPPEEDINILLTGNLAPEDSSLPVVVPTMGAFTVLVQGIQPITQNIDDLASDITFSSFEGSVHIDSVSGNDSNSGNRANPVKTLVQAVSIDNKQGFDQFRVFGNITFDNVISLDDYTFIGDSLNLSTFTFVAGTDTSSTTFNNAHLTGQLSGAVILNVCDVDNLTGIGCTSGPSSMNNCIFHNTIGLRSDNNKDIHISECQSGSAADLPPPVLDINGAACNIVIHKYAGTLKIINCTHADARISFDTAGGALNIDSSCTAGRMAIGGDTKVIGGTGGITVLNNTSASLTWAFSKALTLAKWLGLR